MRHWWLKNKERKIDFLFDDRKFLAAINLTGSTKGALVPVLLRIILGTKSGLPVSPALFLPVFTADMSPFAASLPGGSGLVPSRYGSRGED